jgi:hypothetical protein
MLYPAQEQNALLKEQNSLLLQDRGHSMKENRTSEAGCSQQPGQQAELVLGLPGLARPALGERSLPLTLNVPAHLAFGSEHNCHKVIPKVPHFEGMIGGDIW